VGHVDKRYTGFGLGEKIGLIFWGNYFRRKAFFGEFWFGRSGFEGMCFGRGIE